MIEDRPFGLEGAASGGTVAPAARSGFASDRWFLAVAVLTLCLEGWGLAALDHGHLAVPAAAALHVVLSAAALALAWRRGWQLGYALLAISVAAFGPLGAFGCLVAAAAHLRFARTSTAFEVWYGSLFPEEEDDPGRALYERIIAGRETATDPESLASFTDVLEFGTRDQKEAVITLLTRHFRPAFAPALRLAMRDPTPSVRVQAATAMAHIEGEVLERTLELARAAEAAPRDAAAQLALARHYDDYAFSGLLDQQRERENRRLALLAYGDYLALRPGEGAARVAIARIHLREGRPVEALEILEACLADGLITREGLGWIMECLYRLGRYDALRDFATAHSEEFAGSGTAPGPLGEVVRFWQEPTI